jgi:hypothetical protein
MSKRNTFFVMMRITDATVAMAQLAYEDQGMVELKDRHGIIHKGWVRSEPKYEFGLDAGHWIAFEMMDDESVQDIVARIMTQQPVH